MDNLSGLLCSSTEKRAVITKIIPEKEHDRILRSCSDVPEEVPSFPFPINEVGISDKTVWILLPEGRIPFDTQISVNLPFSSRGIHMSRIEGAISDLYDTRFFDIGDYAGTLARTVALKQSGTQATVILAGKLPLIQKTPASGQVSTDSVFAGAKAMFDKVSGKPVKVMISAAMVHITACPCTQEYNRVLFDANKNIPMPTHSQRSRTKLTVERSNDVPCVKDLVACLKTALHTSNDLLKRQDEAEIVLKSHLAPQFAEDTARETARVVGLLLGNRLPEAARVEIESLSFESIHSHNVTCRISTTLGEILQTAG